MTEYIDIVFDGPPSHESGRFVEVEDDQGRGMMYGDWVHRPDGFWALRIQKDDRKNRPHTHVAGTMAGLDIDTCALCGRDIRENIHSSAAIAYAAHKSC